MFHHPDKKIKTNTKRFKDLTPMVTPSQFLLEGKRPELLHSMSEQSALDSTRFETMCLSLIHNIIHHCQQMPETLNSYYALPGGLVDHALNRTQAALSLFRQFVVQDTTTELSEEQKLWLYALFSASMLQHIGKLQLDYRVELFDNNGSLLGPWNPLLKRMDDAGNYYKFEFQPESEREPRSRITILLARLLMPSSGFAWIISNPQVLAVWLALLSDDIRGAGTLGAILVRADAFALQRYFNEWLNKGHRGGRTHRISTFVDTMPEDITDKDHVTGIEFIKWLKGKLESGELMINKAPHLLMVSGGMLVLPETFEWFVREHPAYKKWQVQRGFCSLGVHQVGIDNDPTTRFEQAHTHQMYTGVLFSKYAMVLPDQVKLHHMKTGEVSTVSATELVHMAHFNQNFFHRKEPQAQGHAVQVLSASGKWQAPAKTSSILSKSII